MYEFTAPDGSVVELVFSMDDVPCIGDKIERNGVTLVRSAGTTRTQQRWKPYVSDRLPRNLEGIPCTKQGKPFIGSKAVEDEVKARLGWERE